MLKDNLTMNQKASELKVLRRQVNQLKIIIENKDIEIKKLREELTDAKQDRSNMLLSWQAGNDELKENLFEFHYDLLVNSGWKE